MKTINENVVCVLETCKDVESLKGIQSFLSGGEIPIQLTALHRKQLVANASQYLLVGEDLYYKRKDEVL